MASVRRDAWQRHIHPKLRMMLNSDPQVNACRAETTGASRVTASLAKTALPLRLGTQASALTAELPATKKLDKAAPRRDVRVHVFVETTGPAKLKGQRARKGNLSILEIPLDEVETVAKRPRVAFVEQAENLKRPGAVQLATSGKPPAERIKASSDARVHSNNGAGVLIGIIDVEGFDWTHPDFSDGKGGNRFVAIWDQGRQKGKPPEGFDYGVEITREAMQKACAEAPAVGVGPHDLEPQSQMVPGSHGTHVASIAAGNSGVCSKADIAAVLVSLPEGDFDRRTSFFDSSRLIDAVNYILAIADGRNPAHKRKRKRKKPVSINISLGTNGHAHDGSSALDRWIDALLAKPGRSICVAAGNAGQEREEKPGDIGYILGRIHTSGLIAATGLDHDIEWLVAGDGLIDVSENELEIWYEAQDRVSIEILPPDGQRIGPVMPGEFIENLQLPDKTFISIYNERYHPANGSNYISVYLTPYTRDVVVGVRAGKWIVRLHGLEIRDGRYHGWIERDDPVPLEGGRYFWPSYFSERSNVDAYSVSSLACGDRIVSVANLDELEQRINITSSQGPTRKGGLKPDVAARGTDVLAANGFGQEQQPWILMTGTSMASPYVAGVIGLMLAAQPNLTAAQINGILKATARPLPGGTYEWADDAGFGVIEPEACVKQAVLAHTRTEVTDRFK
jgi:subtilisin family serine protease